jgi:hypothetical protein
LQLQVRSATSGRRQLCGHGWPHMFELSRNRPAFANGSEVHLAIR